MIFNSIEFAIFFPIVTFVFFVLQHKHRWWWLLASSCYFYMAFKPEYILILFFTIIIDYFAGIWIENSEGSKRKLNLVISLIANIGVLAVFKYYNFFRMALMPFMLEYTPQIPIPPFMSMILPIGLSFHTFQAMSYTIEVYRGNQKAEKHFGIYALYVMFYPQLVAGPIERPQNVLHQFHVGEVSQKQVFNYDRIVSGLQLMAWGFFKKVVIADRLGVYVAEVYRTPGQYHSWTTILATFFFAFEIYCDFSGYSDIAIGSAEVMGFKLMKNFDKPYFSKTISEFWRRWHISLSTWFRDYLYIPLGGNRVAVPRAYFNLFFVFFMSGFWHGANWNYLIWGAIHGFYLIFAQLTINTRFSFNKFIGLTKFPTLYKIVQITTTFILVTFAWMFFKTDYFMFYQVEDFVKGMFSEYPSFSELVSRAYINKFIFLDKSPKEFILSFFFIGFLLGIEYLQRGKSLRAVIKSYPTWLRWTIYYIFVMAFLMFGVFDTPTQFIYFQF